MEDLHKKVAVIKQEKDDLIGDEMVNMIKQVSFPQMSNMLNGLLTEDKNKL